MSGEKIIEGLEQALAYARGDESVGRSATYVVTRDTPHLDAKGDHLPAQGTPEPRDYQVWKEAGRLGTADFHEILHSTHTNKDEALAAAAGLRVSHVTAWVEISGKPRQPI
jgi:hypothetical protein